MSQYSSQYFKVPPGMEPLCWLAGDTPGGAVPHPKTCHRDRCSPAGTGHSSGRPLGSDSMCTESVAWQPTRWHQGWTSYISVSRGEGRGEREGRNRWGRGGWEGLHSPGLAKAINGRLTASTPSVPFSPMKSILGTGATLAHEQLNKHAITNCYLVIHWFFYNSI